QAQPLSAPFPKPGLSRAGAGVAVWNGKCNPVRRSSLEPVELERAMNNTDNTREFRLQIDTHHCTLSTAEQDNIRAEFTHFSRLVEPFPVSDVHVMIEYNGRSNDYSVKTTLILSGATLVGNDHGPVWHAALERCLAGLAENVKAYKERMGQV